MKLRNVLSLSLAAVAALSVGTTAAFASTATGNAILAEATKGPETRTLTSRAYSPTIRVQVRGLNRVYVNPTKAMITETLVNVLDASAADGETKDVKYSTAAGQGVVSTPIFIRSDTNQPLEVNATVTLSSNTITITDNATPAPTGKEAKVQIDGCVNSKTADEIRALMAEADTKTLDLATFLDGTAQPIKAAASTLEGQGATPAVPQLVNSVAKLTAVTPNSEGYYVPQYTALMLTGDVSATPETPWSATDTITARVVLTFGGAVTPAAE